MANITSREIRLVSRPQGMPTAENFALVSTPIAARLDQQVLVRNLYLSVDPYMRGRMNESKSYVPSFELNKALDGGAIGEVVESRSDALKVGDRVTSNCNRSGVLISRIN
jgi:NADPH-dependent curcumin reductase CurA